MASSKTSKKTTKNDRKAVIHVQVDGDQYGNGPTQKELEQVKQQVKKTVGKQFKVVVTSSRVRVSTVFID